MKIETKPKKSFSSWPIQTAINPGDVAEIEKQHKGSNISKV